MKLMKFDEEVAFALVFVLLQIALVTFKLVGFLHISWFWVFAPLWSPLMLGILFTLCLVFIDIYFQASKKGRK